MARQLVSLAIGAMMLRNARNLSLGPPPPETAPSLNFAINTNSQYLPLLWQRRAGF